MSDLEAIAQFKSCFSQWHARAGEANPAAWAFFVADFGYGDLLQAVRDDESSEEAAIKLIAALRDGRFSDGVLPAPGDRPLHHCEARWLEARIQELESGIHGCTLLDRTLVQLVGTVREDIELLGRVLPADDPLPAELIRQVSHDSGPGQRAVEAGKAAILTYIKTGTGDALAPALQSLITAASALSATEARLQAAQQQAAAKMASLSPGVLDAAFETERTAGTSNRGFVAKLLQLRFDIEARFQLEDPYTALDPAGKGRSAHRIYELLQSLPASHTTENPSFLKLVRMSKSTDPDVGGWYEIAEKQIVLTCGSVKKTSPRFERAALEVPNTEEDCKPQDADPPITWFDWTVLHEVGHAVDDKVGFMGQNTGDDSFGGWTALSADALQAEMKKAFPEVHEQYIQHLVTGSGSPPEVKPRTEEYAARLEAALWFHARKSKQKPWAADALAAADSKRFGGYALHEAYDGTWFKYLYSARAQGLTGYQFRAPGEWFAELYAAFHANPSRLKPTHPAVRDPDGWLASLDPP